MNPLPIEGPDDWVERARSTAIGTGPDGSLRMERPLPEWTHVDQPEPPAPDEFPRFRIPWGRGPQ
jgi:hypothetical protein